MTENQNQESSKSTAIQSLKDIATLAYQVASDIETGTHTQSALELSIAISQKLLAYEAFLESELAFMG